MFLEKLNLQTLMNTSSTFPLAPRHLLGLLAALCLPASAPAQLARPAIAAIRVESTNVVVEANIPAGLRKITLECRTHLGRGAWEPRAVARIDGTGGLLTFRLPRRGEFEAMRVRADERDPLPASFYTGTNAFTGDTSGGGAGMLDMAVPGRADGPTTGARHRATSSSPTSGASVATRFTSSTPIADCK